jgi:hypothetical protein
MSNYSSGKSNVTLEHGHLVHGHRTLLALGHDIQSDAVWEDEFGLVRVGVDTLLPRGDSDTHYLGRANAARSTKDEAGRIGGGEITITLLPPEWWWLCNVTGDHDLLVQ